MCAILCPQKENKFGHCLHRENSVTRHARIAIAIWQKEMRFSQESKSLFLWDIDQTPNSQVGSKQKRDRPPLRREFPLNFKVFLLKFNDFNTLKVFGNSVVLSGAKCLLRCWNFRWRRFCSSDQICRTPKSWELLLTKRISSSTAWALWEFSAAATPRVRTLSSRRSASSIAFSQEATSF